VLREKVVMVMATGIGEGAPGLKGQLRAAPAGAGAPGSPGGCPVDGAARFGYRGRMRVDEVTIENFRGIRAMKLPLDPRVNLFVGVNGAGKSTVLDCVAILLARFIEQIQSTTASERQRHFFEDDITPGAKDAKIGLTASHEGHRSVAWTLSRERTGSLSHTRPELKALDPLVNDIRQAISAQNGTSIPVIVYYPVNRAVLEIPQRIRGKRAFEQLNALDAATTGSPETFRIFFEWFRLREDIENEQFRNIQKDKRSFDFDFEDRQLNAVRAAIPKFLDGFKDLRIRRVPPPMRMMVTKGAEELALDQLSDGEKCLLALVGDLARRLAIANPTLPEPLTGSGVVLIDEVDLHLHPGWQRMIVPTLRDTFPGCQFLLTTHSPQIIAHVPPQCVRVLHREAGGIVWGQPGESFGMDTNRVLSEIMGTDERPHDIKARLEALFALIGDGDLAGAREAAAALRADIGLDPELVKAGAVIRRKELIGR
jgi:predicted ATP-binding protein involved in virulence